MTKSDFETSALKTVVEYEGQSDISLAIRIADRLYVLALAGGMPPDGPTKDATLKTPPPEIGLTVVPPVGGAAFRAPEGSPMFRCGPSAS